jgi:hypothetical protein
MGAIHQCLTLLLLTLATSLVRYWTYSVLTTNRVDLCSILGIVETTHRMAALSDDAAAAAAAGKGR